MPMPTALLSATLATLLALGGTVSAQEAAAPLEAATQLRLRDGGILWGQITEHSPDDLSFRRLDTGGLVRLPWGFVDPTQEHALRLGYGYIEAELEEELVPAERIPLADGTELVGVVLERTAEVVHVKNAQAVIALPLARIAGAAVAVQVPASEIYTREERYGQRLAEHADELDAGGAIAAEAHAELAAWCEGVRDYQHAVDHLRAVPVADPTWPLEELAPALERTTRKAEAQEQADVLSEIERLTRRDNFDKALAMLEAFPKQFPGSPLMEDWNDQRERTLKAQLRALREEVSKRWHAAAARVAREAARMDSYEATRSYAEERMGEDILALVMDDLRELDGDLSAEETRTLFYERQGGRWRRSSYGNGTWLLGAEKARASLEADEEGAEEAGGGEQDDLRKQLEEKIKRYLENQTAARSSSDEDGESPEDFWASYSLTSRANWVLSYYAEYSGDMKLRRAQFSNCRECGGSGVREVVNLGSAKEGGEGAVTRLVSCPTCHNIGVVRRISYR